MTSLSKEEENYVRMGLLLTGVSAGATRTLFDQEFPPGNLKSSMGREIKRLRHLKKRGVVTQHQWNLLFPRRPDLPDSIEFDATLMITLLRHLTDLNPPHGGFDKLPSPSEKTPGSDLARIKYYRDFLANLDDAKIDNVFFIHAWDDISEAIGRLGGQSLKQECDQLKTKILDQTNEQIVLESEDILIVHEELKQPLKQECDQLNLKTKILDQTNGQIVLESKDFEIEELKQSLIDIRQFHESANPGLFHFAGTSEEFQQLLSAGTYESFENRVFLCGSCACGKSTLASILIGSPIPRIWKSTDGLVIHFGRNGINLETYEMVPLKEENRGHNVLAKVVIGKPHLEKNTNQCTESQDDQPFTLSSSSYSTDLPMEGLRGSEAFLGANPIKHERKKDLAPRRNWEKIEAYAVQDDILKEVESGQYKMKIAPSDLVDFGGQRSYDMTHQLFVQHGGTFVVMFDGSKNFQEPLKEYPLGYFSNESIVKHWVNSILTYCVHDDDVMPKILFAATHSDVLKEDMKQMKIEFAKKVTEMFGTHEMSKHIVFDPVFFINGTDKDDREIQNLKNQLVTIARNQPSWGLRRPMIWVPLELLITNMKNDNINIILKSHLADANKKNGDLALSDQQLDDFLLTQHALGKIMYFKQPEINNFIILYPPALVNILRAFITDEMFWPAEETLSNVLRKMTVTGKIYISDLLKLWQQEQFDHYIHDDDIKEFVIKVLVHLDILVLPKRYIGKNDTHADYFLVPCTVNHNMPMSFLDEKTFGNRSIALVYRLKMSSIPSALAFKLIGAVSGIWPIKEEYDRPLLYHSSAVLCVDKETEFRIIVEDTKVIVYLTHVSSRYSISPDIAASIQECLTFTLEAVLKFYLSSFGKTIKKIDVSSLFQIEVGEVCGRYPCVLSISKANQTSDWVCDSGNKHFSRYPLLWYFNKTQDECPSKCPGLEETVLISSPSEKQLSRLANQLSFNNCRRLMIHFGLLNDWEDIQHSFSMMPLISKIMAFDYWRRTKIKGKPSKSFKNLLDALKAIGDERHLLCKVFREDTELLDIAYVRLQEIPCDEVLNGLPMNLGNCAIQLGIELGITLSSIEETLVRYHKDMYGQISDILRKWKISREVKPTIYRLMLALERVDTGGLEYLKKIYLS